MRAQPGAAWPSWLVFLIPLWGATQLLAHTTASTSETRAATLRWGSLAGVFLVSQLVGAKPPARRLFLEVFLWFATLTAVLCILQISSSNGMVLWIFPSGYDTVFAWFQYHANYAQFIELALPVAIWKGLRAVERSSWRYALSAGVLYASVIASASRAGVALCTAELLALLAIAWVGSRRSIDGVSRSSALIVLVAVPLIACVFSVAVGTNTVLRRFQQSDQYLVRREFLSAALDMVRNQPLTGYGLGTFPEVYQRYAIRDFPFYANHAHNDWAEFAAEGGLPFLLLILIPLAGVVPASLRHPWGLGIPAVMLHAIVDYPFARPAVCGWLFALLGLLYIADSRSSARDS
jgi:O-antigen ligase